MQGKINLKNHQMDKNLTHYTHNSLTYENNHHYELNVNPVVNIRKFSFHTNILSFVYLGFVFDNYFFKFNQYISIVMSHMYITNYLKAMP